MHRIKFRAWNIIVHRYQYFTLLDLKDVQEKIQWHIIKVEQYIGLKDISGKDIYEGDIVDCGNNIFRKIKWVDGGFIAITNGGDNVYCLNWNMLEVKIIGNINQNQELWD